MSFTTIEIEQQPSTATIWLNRPDVHNAINGQMIEELTTAYKTLDNDETVRIIILRGRGKSFCAGADIKWMQAAAQHTHQQNLKESEQLALCFQTIYHCSKPTIAVAHGSAMGGATGLLSASDFAYCTEGTIFSLSEVKLGFIPATISPYVIRRVGEYTAKDIMLTARRFNGIEAAQLKLVNQALPETALETQLNDLINHLWVAGPNAMVACKKLIHDVVNENYEEGVVNYTAKAIADIRTSDEAREGMAAFFEKRKPNWSREED